VTGNFLIAIIPSAFFSFNAIILSFFVFPSGLFALGFLNKLQIYSDWGLEVGAEASLLSLITCVLFWITFNFMYLVFSSGRVNLFYKIRNSSNNINIYNMHGIHISLLRCFWIYAACGVLVYFFLSGYQKLSLLGSGVDAWDYRMIGFDDTSLILKVLLETSRRVLLPFLLVTEIIRIKYCGGKLLSIKNIYLFMLIAVMLISIASTLDRGPLLVFFMAIIFPLLMINPNIYRFVRSSFFGLATIGIFASVLTYLQYNKTEFSYDQILFSAIQFIFQRVFLDPSFTAISLGFDLFPAGGEFLNFRFSRIGVLFGSDYIGTESSDSVFVAPVGAVADAWRNYSYLGVVFTAFINSLIAIRVDHFIKRRASLPFSLSISFVYFSFVFFQVFGVFYSMGAFFQIFFLLILPFFLKNYKN
jgi:hypothetical protein